MAAIVAPEGQPLSRLGALVAQASSVAIDLGIVGGVGSVGFAEPSPLGDGHRRSAMIDALGGISGIDEQVSWFRHVTSPRTAETDEIHTDSV